VLSAGDGDRCELESEFITSPRTERGAQASTDGAHEVQRRRGDVPKVVTIAVEDAVSVAGMRVLVDVHTPSSLVVGRR
jgi:hypothetical protein